jgi:hypothetical protein
MGNIGFENLKELGLALRDTYNLDTFIETGTYRAYTSSWASGQFKNVITIEADEGLHKRAQMSHKDKKNIKFILGDSATELAKVLKRRKKPALIWLDAHWCKSGDSPRPECPLREELQAILESGVEHFILIDDARLFENPPNEQWPTLEEINKSLPDFYTSEIWNDAIIAFPIKATSLVTGFTTPKPVESKLEPVVLTSNNYLRCLPPFAYLFNQFWGKEQAVKVVRYEIRPHNLPANFTNYAIGKQEDYTWSSGLIKYLKDHEGELILLMLEDYFLDGRVNIDEVKRAWDCITHFPEVAKIDLTNDRLKVPHSRWDDRFIQSAPDAPFQTSLQAAIWRKDFLLRFLDPDENPWQFERRGTKRVITAREAGTFDGLILGFKQPPMSYVNAVGGEGQNSDKWDRKKFPSWMWSELEGRGLV